MNDERPRTRPSPMLVVAMGISTAALGLALLDHIKPSPANPQLSPSAAAAMMADPARLPAAQDIERVRRLERRVAELSSSSKVEEPAPRSAPEAAEPLDPETARREETLWWEGVLKTHDQQGRDAAWAPKTEELFHADLAAVAAGRRFEATEIGCRTSSCAVTLKWPSYDRDEIRKDASFVAGHSYQENCATSISVPPPEDPSLPYQAKIVFDCARSRADIAHR